MLLRISLAVLLVFTCATQSFASAQIYTLEILGWAEEGKQRLMMTVRINGGEKKIIHIRHNPDRLSGLLINKGNRPMANEEYNRGYDLLVKQLKEQKAVEVWLLSDAGFLPIKGRKGHFRADSMYVTPWDSTGKRVCLVHSDLGSISPD